MRRNDRILPLGLFVCGILAACGAKKPVYPNCAGDNDCKRGEHCVEQKCLQCAVDSDCAPGQQCEGGGCKAIEGWCSADGDCPSGQICKSNQCMSCQADDECGGGGRCKAGTCLRKGQCLVDEDCAEDEDCLRGVCVKGGTAPTSQKPPTCKLETLFFAFDEANIPEDGKATLQDNAECLSTTPLGVIIIGHTDPRGTDEYNIALSDQRARAVADYLARLGLDPARLMVVPKGEADATGSDEESWAQDRRVEFMWQ